MLRLIRRYLNAGVLANGVVIERHEGTPQGGPLSPLLANVLLDEIDKELERRGHAYSEVNPDYTQRPDPSELLPVLDRLRASRAA